MAEDEIVRLHHLLNGHEFEQTLGDSEGQRSLECCSPWGCRESDMTWQLNNNSKTETVKNPPAMWETGVQSLDQEDPLE